MDIIRKIEQLVVEFPGLGECLELTLKKAFPIIKQVTTIIVKRVDGNLLNRVLVRERYDEYKRHSVREQEIWVLIDGDAVLVDIKKAVVESSPGRFVRELGETVGSRLVDFNRIQHLVLTDEVYDWDNNTIELKVTVYKPAKGSSIPEDVAWEVAFPIQTPEEIAAEMELGFKAIQDQQDAEMDAALEQHYELERQARDDDREDENDEYEPTEVNVGGHPGSWLIFE